ncbi:hypothetical protein CP532_1278 [Ophiocordyceps camponoti-leonardi (nom. inval.)]|nr:hypothetical protein CP532_1278 [Ophiocordyceps camponoti-leonardi (nom. inval.)]
MVRLQSFVLACLSAAPVLALDSNGTVGSDGSTSSPDFSVVPATLMVECETSALLEEIDDIVKSWGGSIRHKVDSDVYRAVSFELADETDVETKKPILERKQGVKAVSRVQRMKSPVKERLSRSDPTFEKRDTGKRFGTPWTHVVTQVDKLHAKGFKGNGLRIAIVDSGINYKLPVFGGRVAFGRNLLADRDGSDIMDCTGHGTAVAGVLAGFDEASGYVGVAPNATLGAYRVSDCHGLADEDAIIAGWVAAFQDKPDIIASSSVYAGLNWPEGRLSKIVSSIGELGVPSIAAFGNQGPKGLFRGEGPAVGRGVIAVGAFSTTIDHMADFTSFGPAWDLSIKPNVAVPGANISVPTLDGGYTEDSGTSFAAPLVAGIVALLLEARKTRLPVGFLQGMLMTTAAPQQAVSGRFISVAGQGAGLVQAWDAATVETLVYPPALAFSDSEHRVPSFQIVIANSGPSKVEYRLSHVPAATKYVYGTGLGSDAAADIRLSHDSIVVESRQTAAISVSASDPQGIDLKRLPVWSGWIAINGSEGSSLTVPYLGMAGSMRSATTITADDVSLMRSLNGLSFPVAANSTFILPNPPSGEQLEASSKAARPLPKGAFHGLVGVVVRLSFGTPILWVDIMPVDAPETMVSRLGEVHQGRRTDVFSWNGQLGSGGFASPGRYKFVIRALSVFGDFKEPKDWQVVESPVFTIAYEHMYKA